MKTEDLINDLTANLKPIKIQSNPEKFSFEFFTLTLLIIGIGLIVSSFRKNLNLVTQNYFVIIEIVSTLGLIFSGLIVIAWLTSPGRRLGKIYKAFSFLTFFFLLIINSYRVSTASLPSAIERVDSNCFFVAIFFSMIISITLFYSIKKRVVTKSVTIGILVGLTSAAGGLLAITLHCPSTDLIHISLFHYFLPMSTASVAGALAGKYYLRW